MNDFVIKLPLAMRFYLIGLIYRNSRMSCVCLASLVEIAHDQLYRVLYLAFAYSRRMWEWFAVHLVKDGYLIIDERDLAKIRQKTRSGFLCLGFEYRQKSVGNQCRFAALDGRTAAHSGRGEDLAERRKIKVKTRRRNALGSPSARRNSKVCLI